MYTEYTLQFGLLYLGISDPEIESSIRESNKTNLKWLEEKEIERNKWSVPQGLLKKEYEAMKKELTAILLVIKDNINKTPIEKRGPLTFEQMQYMVKKDEVIRLINLRKRDGEMNIEKAKAYPMTDLLTFKGGFAKCPFHEEKSGSAKYYSKENKIHCFGACCKSFDPIDVYMQINNVDFNAAIKALS